MESAMDLRTSCSCRWGLAIKNVVHGFMLELGAERGVHRGQQKLRGGKSDMSAQAVRVLDQEDLLDDVARKPTRAPQMRGCGAEALEVDALVNRDGAEEATVETSDQTCRVDKLHCVQTAHFLTVSEGGRTNPDAVAAKPCRSLRQKWLRIR